MRRLGWVIAAAMLMIEVAVGQEINSQALLHPAAGTWPTYNGDYSGRRFSPLAQINAENVARLTLAWKFQAKPGDLGNFLGGQIKSTPLLADGVLYFSMPDNVWAVDAHTGHEIWHYRWQSAGGIHIGNRGVGIYGDWLYFLTPDNHLISLEKKTGKQRWTVKTAEVDEEYFSTMAPLVVGKHLVIGIGGDSLDLPGFLEARDPETGALQWRWDAEPKPGEPGSETWPSSEAMAHGGGMTWLTGTYDPELNLLYWGTGNPNPVMAGQSRKGANLWTCSIVALNPDTGKLVWYFQASPHDTHDFDNVETPVLFDAKVDGKPRKLLAQAARNGYFFVLDRTSGKNLLTKPYVNLNWSLGVNESGVPIPDANKEPKPDGALVSPASIGATNWNPPSYSVETGLFYVNASQSYSEFYLTDASPNPQGYGGKDLPLYARASLRAIDPTTGDVEWSHNYHEGFGMWMPGILTTAGKLLFTGDPATNLIAFDPATGKLLWHYRMDSGLSNGPETFLLNGKQYLVVGGGEFLYAFTLGE